MNTAQNSEPTLFLIQSSYAASTAALQKLAQMHMPGDSVVLMGEAVMFAAQIAETYSDVAILENEAQLLNDEVLSASNLQTLSYDTFASLCLQHQRCVSLK